MYQIVKNFFKKFKNEKQKYLFEIDKQEIKTKEDCCDCYPYISPYYTPPCVKKRIEEKKKKIEKVIKKYKPINLEKLSLQEFIEFAESIRDIESKNPKGDTSSLDNLIKFLKKEKQKGKELLDVLDFINKNAVDLIIYLKQKEH